MKNNKAKRLLSDKMLKILLLRNTMLSNNHCIMVNLGFVKVISE